MRKEPKRYGMVIDLDLCVGCRGCEVACRQEHDLKPHIGEELDLRTERIPHWTEVMTVGPWGTFPDLDMFYFPRICNHCDEAPCVEACPSGAMTQRDDGVVFIQSGRCITCLKCLDACPFRAIFYDREEDSVSKCNFCFHLVDHGLEPACVSTCMTRCRIFGDLNDPESEPSRILRERKAEIVPIPAPWWSPARPSTYYIRNRGIRHRNEERRER
jgi:molybdopterin-containing oxidoreductase family iron-sulfur binding subunit